jgi:hypothetical protein
MKLLLLRFALGLSLVLLAGAGGMWCRSRLAKFSDEVWRFDRDYASGTRREQGLWSLDGAIVVLLERRTFLDPILRDAEFGPAHRGPRHVLWERRSSKLMLGLPPGRSRLERMGLRVDRFDGVVIPGKMTGSKLHVTIPYWLLMALAMVAPLLSTCRYLRQRREAGRCPVCGYDLRATPERCPECGATPSSADAAAERAAGADRAAGGPLSP